MVYSVIVFIPVSKEPDSNPASIIPAFKRLRQEDPSLRPDWAT
jgi:hypothetical protein